MIPKHAIFATHAAADAAAASGEASLLASLLAAAKSALPAELQATAGSVPLVTGRIISATASPAMRLPDPVTNGFKDVYPATSIVLWELVTSDGKRMRVRSVVANSALPPPVKTSGVATVTGTLKAKVLVRASMPDEAYFTATGAGTLGANTYMTDPNTGKRYKTSGATAYVAGPFIAAIVEESSSEAGEMSHGQSLVIQSAPSTLLPVAQVIRLAAVTIPDLSVLVDSATGKRYKTSGVAATTAIEKLAGDSTVTVSIVRDTTDGVADEASVEVGTVLTFTPAIAKAAASASVTVKSETAVPINSPLVDGATGKSYKTTTAITVYDSLTTSVTFEALVAEAASDLTTSHTLTFTPSITNISASAPVTAAYGVQLYPIDIEPQIVGAALSIDATSRAETYGGQWSATLRSETDSNG